MVKNTKGSSHLANLTFSSFHGLGGIRKYRVYVWWWRKLRAHPIFLSVRKRGLFMFGQIRFLPNPHFLSHRIWQQMKELFGELHFGLWPSLIWKRRRKNRIAFILKSLSCTMTNCYDHKSVKLNSLPVE